MWPASPFEEWLEDSVQFHWMTAQWFAQSDTWWGDYAILLSVFVPVLTSIEEFRNDYGNAFVMTKLSV
jgi:hypothetical protein